MGETHAYLILLKRFSVGLYSYIYRLSFLFKFSMMMGTTKLYILISVWMTLTFIQGHSCTRNQKLWYPFSQKFCSGFGEIQSVITTYWVVELMLNVFCTSNIQGREHC